MGTRILMVEDEVKLAQSDSDGAGGGVWAAGGDVGVNWDLSPGAQEILRRGF